MRSRFGARRFATIFRASPRWRRRTRRRAGSALWWSRAPKWRRCRICISGRWLPLTAPPAQEIEHGLERSVRGADHAVRGGWLGGDCGAEAKYSALRRDRASRLRGAGFDGRIGAAVARGVGRCAGGRKRGGQPEKAAAGGGGGRNHPRDEFAHQNGRRNWLRRGAGGNAVV